jgi:hypothetical protein
MPRKKKESQFLLCVNNAAYPASLELRKVYHGLPDATAASRNLVRVVDESGEDYLYPAELFVPIELPQAARRALASYSA